MGWLNRKSYFTFSKQIIIFEVPAELLKFLFIVLTAYSFVVNKTSNHTLFTYFLTPQSTCLLLRTYQERSDLIRCLVVPPWLPIRRRSCLRHPAPTYYPLLLACWRNQLRIHRKVCAIFNRSASVFTNHEAPKWAKTHLVKKPNHTKSTFGLLREREHGAFGNEMHELELICPVDQISRTTGFVVRIN